METKWLEDFISLAETRSFSRSASLRHVTQPAFSRRIQSLEAWAGTDLIDRSAYPTRLTPAGEVLYGQALGLLQALQTARALLHAPYPPPEVGDIAPNSPTSRTPRSRVPGKR
jgi:DNA-binding transcriptional LysR family regulator